MPGLNVILSFTLFEPMLLSAVIYPYLCSRKMKNGDKAVRLDYLRIPELNLVIRQYPDIIPVGMTSDHFHVYRSRVIIESHTEKAGKYDLFFIYRKEPAETHKYGLHFLTIFSIRRWDNLFYSIYQE